MSSWESYEPTSNTAIMTSNFQKPLSNLKISPYSVLDSNYRLIAFVMISKDNTINWRNMISLLINDIFVNLMIFTCIVNQEYKLKISKSLRADIKNTLYTESWVAVCLWSGSELIHMNVPIIFPSRNLYTGLWTKRCDIFIHLCIYSI